MAISYDQRKQKYEAFDDSQKQKWGDLVNNSKEGDVMRQYMDQYNQEKNQTTTNQTSNESNLSNNQTPTVQKTEKQNPTQTNQTYGKTEFDKDEKLDTEMFGTAPGKITVQEGTAKDTGKPDYTLSSDARLNEMKGNLDQYFSTSPRMFKDRETFNKMFQYNERESDAQRQLLDSYWKRKEDMDKASQYTSGESISNGLKKGQITTDQLNLIKEYDPKAYQEWQQKQEEEIQLRIVNNIVPPLLEDISSQMISMMNNLGIQQQDALDIEQIYNDTMESTGAYQTLQDANRTVRQIEEVNNKMTSIANRYANSTGGTVSDALAAARMQKALAPYQTQMQGLQYQYQDYANLYNQKLATANQAAAVRQMQAQENQRVWDQRLTALGFAQTAMSYRTPEQQAQLQLQVQQAENEISLLQQSKQNDLALYNAYATAKLNNQLSAELTDLNVADPTQLRANLNNVLSSYYSQWGDIIQRPQAQVVDDVIAYAQKNGISVAEALRKNFIEPLQSKQEYKNKIASNYAAPTSTSSVGYSKITINGKDYLVQGGKIVDPASIGIGGGTGTTSAKSYNIVSPEVMEGGIDAFASSVEQGQTYGQCGKFVNDYLVAIGATSKDERYFGNEDVSTRAKRCNQQTATKGAVAVFNYNHLSDDGINHGHVAIVTQTYADGSFDVIESNYPSGQTVNKKRHVEANDAACLGFINPSLGASSSQGYNTQDPYSGVSKYTSTGKEVNAGGWITSLEKSFDRWEKLTDTQRKDLYSSYGLDVSELNEQRERYMNYVETKQMVDSLLDVKDRAMKLKEWAEKDTNKNLKGWMDIDIANQGYAGFWQNIFTSDTTISNIQEGKALYDNLMSNAGFQKYLDMKDKGAQFGIMTDSEWNKVDSSVAPLKREQKDDLFIKNLNSMIEGYDQVLMQLGYDSSEGAKPDTAEQVEVTENKGANNSEVITMVIDGQVKYSYDGGKTRH